MIKELKYSWKLKKEVNYAWKKSFIIYIYFFYIKEIKRISILLFFCKEMVMEIW
jgi:hypothetical protein